MPPRTQRGAAKMQRNQLDVPSGFDWDWNDVRIFLACARLRSLRKAADRLGLNSSTITRRIEGFEQRLGVPLLKRLPEGVTPTQAGLAIFKSAEQMERAFFDAVRKVPPHDAHQRGFARVSITEGLGIYWVMPRLVDFSRQHPNLTVDLRCAMESADVLRMEADLAVQLVRPTSPGLIVTKLGRLHIYPFAAQSYVNRYGLPKNASDMINHRVVFQAAPQVDSSAWARHLGLDDIQDIVGIRSNSSSALFYAIERGAGIGALPTYACAVNASVVPVDIDVHHSLDIWLTYHPDVRNSRHLAFLIDWIRMIFDPQHYPWFRDEFIHPNDLIKRAPRAAELHSVKGFFAVKPFAD